MATLAAKGVFLVGHSVNLDSTETVSPTIAAGGYTAGDEQLPDVAEVASPLFVSQIPSAVLAFDEDKEAPFGHALLGFDEVPSVVPNPLLVADAGVMSQTLARMVDVEAPWKSTGAHASHQLCGTAHVIWCKTCGRHAAVRLGVGLLRKCRGTADGAYPTRLERLRAGKHPVSGNPL